MKTVVLIVALFAALALAAPAYAEETLLHPMFADHAVLQRGQPINVYGRAAPGETVTVSLAGAAAEARADEAGAWSAQLPALDAGGPYELTARTSGGASQGAADVMVGDVFLCSGQSNMEVQVHRALDARSEIQNSANNNIRLLRIANATSLTPLETFAAPVAWQVAAPAVVPEWSATCYYFARELRKTIDVPVGLVVAAWGGSNIRAWMSQDALRATGAYDADLDLLRLYGADPAAAIARQGERWTAWWRAHGGAGEPWAAARARDWRAAPAGLGFWEGWGVPELAAFNGLVWHRTSVRLGASQARQGAQLSLGAIDEIDMTFVNGRPLAYTMNYGGDREYALAPGALRAGENLIVVGVVDTYASGGMGGDPAKRALRLADGRSVALDGRWEYLISPPAYGYPPRAPWESTGGMSTIGAAMIAPIGRYGFKGVVWYQGESNTREPQTYERLLAGLMTDWRERFLAPELPFLIVQLANYGAVPTAPTESGTAQTREAQRQAALHDAHAGLAVTIDIGNPRDIHPADKQELGRRLARAARHVIYGEAIAPSGPAPISARRAEAEIVVSFRDVEGGLVAHGAEGPIGFELCWPAAGSCRYAQARLDGDEARLAIPSGLEPARVRFCWAESPICTLYDRAGLPAGPFEIVVE